MRNVIVITKLLVTILTRLQRRKLLAALCTFRHTIPRDDIVGVTKENLGRNLYQHQKRSFRGVRLKICPAPIADGTSPFRFDATTAASSSAWNIDFPSSTAARSIGELGCLGKSRPHSLL